MKILLCPNKNHQSDSDADPCSPTNSDAGPCSSTKSEEYDESSVIASHESRVRNVILSDSVSEYENLKPQEEINTNSKLNVTMQRLPQSSHSISTIVISRRPLHTTTSSALNVDDPRPTTFSTLNVDDPRPITSSALNVDDRQLNNGVHMAALINGRLFWLIQNKFLYSYY